MLKRALSGSVYVAVIVAGILCGKFAFLALSLLLAVMAVNEFTNLTAGKTQPNGMLRLLDLCGAAMLVISAWGWCGDMLKAPMVLLPWIIYLIGRMSLQLSVIKPNAVRDMALSLMGQIYTAVPIALMSAIYFRLGTPHILLAIFIMIWLNDTGAYLVGSQIGRHRMSPNISPKKSWEGFVGGVLFTIIAGVLMGTCFTTYFAGYSWIELGILGFVVSLMATIGDLIESLIKRTMGVKDSGNLIPGHGGILDRIDSLLLVVPSAVIFLIVILGL